MKLNIIYETNILIKIIKILLCVYLNYSLTVFNNIEKLVNVKKI